MKNLLFTLLATTSFTAFSQYTHDEGSFQKTFTQVRNHQIIGDDPEWSYTGGRFCRHGPFHFNVDFFPCPGCPEMRGTIMENI